MFRSVLVTSLLIALGAAVAGIAITWRAPNGPAAVAERTASSREPARGFGAVGAPAAGPSRADLERRIERLEATIADQAAERRRLEARLDEVMDALAARGGADEPADASSTAETAAQPSPNHAPNEVAEDHSASAVEQALASAGIDRGSAAEIKRRRDELAMAEMYLRDRATREQWLDTPRFSEEMAAIDAQRTSIRDQVGDDAYDRYLFALGETNRVRVDDVLASSPAAEAGLQPGDLIVSYADARIFAPADLVAATHAGTAGTTVQLEVLRNGERFQFNVPRGPLGLQIMGTRGNPDVS
ncbi:MAG: PDZ domain-containing protein [Candidatus Binatia bacterium]